MNPEKILVVDDEEAIREVVSTLLEAQGYRCTVCANGRLALEAFRKDSFDLALSDIVMPEMDGLKLLAELRSEDPDVPVIMVTAMHDISIALEAIRAGAYDYILKPFEKDQLHLSVRRALEHRRLVMENRTYQSDLEQLVAERTQQLSGAQPWQVLAALTLVRITEDVVGAQVVVRDPSERNSVVPTG